uniref:Uncharacterized protein n=1 Tax=Parascaris univalens TaxID=6257 RepID=A0A915B9L6_PARUN
MSRPLRKYLSTLPPRRGLIGGPVSISKPTVRRPSETTPRWRGVAEIENQHNERSTREPPREQYVGVWMPMENTEKEEGISPRTISHSSKDTRIFTEYTAARRLRKPVRVEIRNARGCLFK